MATYLLLRNNKESGPYSLSELQTKGLKAYDLVWIEGKSAAWRYPSEVDELKSFAPIVEEQPYDRFFKKPSEQTQSSQSITVPPVQEKEIVNTTAQKQQPVVVNLNNKNVYVTMPAGQTFVAAKKEVVTEEPKAKEKEFVQKPFINTTTEYKEDDPVPKTVAKSSPVSSSAFIDRDEGSPTNYKETLRKNPNILPDRTGGQLKIYTKPVIMLLGTVLLLGAGIFIGMWINQRGTNSTKQGIVLPQNVQDGQHSVIPVSTTPGSAEILTEKNNKAHDSVATIISAGNAEVLANKIAAVNDRKKAKAQKEKSADSSNGLISKPATDSSYITITHREATHRNDVADEKPSSKINIAELVSLSANKYAVGAFGGISDLQVTVTNQSPYPLDLVVVEVQYVQANKKIFKTENLYFHNVGAGAALMQDAPKSPRGIKVEYKLTLVNSKQPGLAYSGI